MSDKQAEAEPDVELARADVRIAEDLVTQTEADIERLEQAVIGGDEDIEPQAITAAESLSRFAKLRKAAAERKLARAEELAVVAARRALRDDILTRAPENGQHLVVALKAVEDAVKAFVTLADAHTADVRAWGQRATDLGVPDQGYESAEHEGLGVSSVGDVLAGGARIGTVSPSQLLGQIFSVGQNDALRVRYDTAPVYEHLASVGKAS